MAVGLSLRRPTLAALLSSAVIAVKRGGLEGSPPGGLRAKWAAPTWS